MKVNINDIVRVRLTDEGRAIHRRNYDALMTALPQAARFEYMPPKESQDGWSEWQMWHLLQQFGLWCRMGFTPPFETVIDIPETKD
jgi:hypothetical protein